VSVKPLSDSDDTVNYRRVFCDMRSSRIAGCVVTVMIFLIVCVPSHAGGSLDKLIDEWKSLSERGEHDSAIPVAEKMLRVAEAEIGRDSEEAAACQMMLGMSYTLSGRHCDAEPRYSRALEIEDKTGTKENALPIVGSSLIGLSASIEVCPTVDNADRKIINSVKIADKFMGSEHVYVANFLESAARMYHRKNSYDKSEPLYIRALSIQESQIAPDNSSIRQLLVELGALYFESGRYGDAEPFYKRLLRIEEDKQGSGSVDLPALLSNISYIYLYTGRYDIAESTTKRLIEINTSILGRDHPDVAANLNILGGVYQLMGRYDDAESLHRRALDIQEKAFGIDSKRTAFTLRALGNVYVARKRFSEAESLMIRAVKIEENHSPDELCFGLIDLAIMYGAAGKYLEAEQAILRAMPLAVSSGNLDAIKSLYGEYAVVLSWTNRRSAAIYCLKNAVNIAQKIRASLKNTEGNALSAYTNQESATYRALARALTNAGRIPEAEQVLELLKEQENFQFVRGNEKSSLFMHQATMTSYEGTQEKILKEASVPLAKLYARRGALKDLKHRTPEEEKELDQLTKETESASKAFAGTLDRIVKNFGEMRPEEARELREAAGLQDDLRELGEGSVAIYSLVDKESSALILVTPKFRKAYTVPVGAKEMAKKVGAFRAALLDPSIDPRPLGQELYRILLGPAEAELKEYGAKTLMWSLDGVLRYIPISALYDGNDYLVMKYRTVLFTPASKSRWKDQPKALWNGLGLGLSKERSIHGVRFAALESVPQEMSSIFGKAVKGESFLDEPFTWNLMKDRLEEKGSYSLVHVASHFHMDPADYETSYLVLGDGTPLTLKKVNDEENLFGGVDLLTLSACNTAVGGVTGRDGREMDSLSMIAQQKGAKAVLASLWPVSDESTALLMSEFYRLREKEHLPKGEALRRAQVSLLKGEMRATGPAKERGAKTSRAIKQDIALGKPFPQDAAKPYSHPYYWAPFVLTGNWK
jgi:CHAT domain-containing protein